jgi:hypothetical protein
MREPSQYLHVDGGMKSLVGRDLSTEILRVTFSECLTIRSEQSPNTTPLHASVPDWD